ncbi:MAG: hypothetical protein OEM62_02950, partial [Acidobacteriota bacterium]|nr:hypothetical protein [Acidobacteriota bacterium]
RAFLEKRSSSARGGDRTLYRLGLIYSLRESPLYDPTKARQLLQELAQRPGPYGRQAALVLRLQLQVSELQQEATTHALLSASLEQELGRMEEEAAAASTVVGEQKDRTQRLTNEIEQLRAEIAALTQALDLKRQELTRIKEIDLERLP